MSATTADEQSGPTMSERLDLPVAPFRRELDVFPLQENGDDFLVLRDPEGYSRSMLQISPAAWGLMLLFDGVRTPRDVHEELKRVARVNITPEQILGFSDELERNLFLATDRFLGIRVAMDAEYSALPVREPAHAGQSYPGTRAELTSFLDGLFAGRPAVARTPVPLGVIAPHIDLQVGPEVYVPAYEHLRDADIDTVVILGTSHYSSEDLFILTEKDFATPLGTMRTDGAFVRALRTHSGGIFTTRDVAHRAEHSIEFQVLFLQHLFGNERVRIVPVLCTSFEHFLEEGALPMEDARYRAFIDAFGETQRELGRRIMFVLSVDWSHVGRKFGDERPASALLPAVRASDHEHFAALERADLAGFHALLRPSMNATRIDGLSCITTFFDLAHPSSGTLLAYDQWHEEERESGVTFASMAFWRKSG
ncbi:MAG: AmmeMemoRadiSam system protein B [Ignavibacteria bacterium]|nr:AmmeMemoRadiSam system protein B [Ignavibacteria bacterium]